MTTFRAVVPALAMLLAGLPLAAQTPELPPPLPPLPAQATGRVVGRVLEEGTGAPIAGAQVNVVGHPLRAISAIDGRYTLLNVPAGSVALSVRAVGYSPKTVEGIVVPPGSGVAQDVTLAGQTVQLGEITVSATLERGSVAAALEEQRNAGNVISAVSGEQIARTPDSDAGQAVQRVSGVTVQDGRYVFVRGLGERYTTTSLNGSRIPSPEPERRVVPLDLFPSNLLDAITTTKTFTPDQPGDFTGGQVDLRTREFPLRRTASLSVSAGLNDAIAGRAMPRAPTVGREWLGYAGAQRRLPDAVRSAAFTSLSLPERQQLVGVFRNAWSAEAADGTGNGSLSLSVGGEDPVFGRLVGYLASFGYGTSQDIRRNEQRAVAATGSQPGTARPLNLFRGETGTSAVQWGGMLNLSTRLGATTKLTIANTYTRSADNTVTRLAGVDEQFGPRDITRLAFVERAVHSHQIRGEHLFGLRHAVDWFATGTGVRRYEPDRSDLIYQASIDTVTGAATPTEWDGGPRTGNRTFSDLTETSFELGLNYRLELGAGRRTAVKVGVNRRLVERDADSRAYDILNVDLSSAERRVPAEQIFAQPGRLDLNADANLGRYTARDEIVAGYAQLEFPLGARVRVIGGARVERWALDLTTRTFGGTLTDVPRRNTDVLPSLAVTWQLGASQQLRFSASQTLSRPEYREMAPVGSRDIAGGLDFFGDSTLRRALVRSFDARWELYPTPGEVVSVAVFAKFFDNPIERVLVGATGATTVSFANADAARNYGIELEARRSLRFLSEGLLPFAVFANATFMRSRVDISNVAGAAQRSTNRPMAGQAGYVVNAGLGYTSGSGSVNATLLYNVVGRRIYEAGTTLLPDAYEEARHGLDLSLRLPGFGGTSLKLDAKNLLNAPFHITQGDVTRLRYDTGRTYALGISWQP